jgi:hypothetical protein
MAAPALAEYRIAAGDVIDFSVAGVAATWFTSATWFASCAS